MTRRGSRPLSHAQQALLLRAHFPNSMAEVGPGRLSWRGRLQPTPLGRCYLVSVEYVRNNFPVVRILEPPLEAVVGRLLPHQFRDGTLCLHERHEWRPDMRLVETTVAWTCEWLYFYEIWLGTGLWFGDGDEDGRELHGVEDANPFSPGRTDRRSTARHQRRRRRSGADGRA